MGMSTHIILLRDIGSHEHKKMMAAVNALWDAGITEMPKAMAEYFKTEEIDEINYLEEEAMKVYSGYIPGGIESPGLFEIFDDGMQGVEIDIQKLPKGVRFIRVYNSY